MRPNSLVKRSVRSRYFFVCLAAAIIFVALLPLLHVRADDCNNRAPDAPSGLTATPGEASITLTWGAASCAEHYNIWRTGPDGEHLIQISADYTTLIDQILPNG